MSVRAIAVDYQNTLPLRAGLEPLRHAGELSLDLAHPAEATRRFARGEYVLGLLPAAAALDVPEAEFVGTHGIVSDGFVGSVGIFSEVPLERVRRLYLDHDSRSSVLLAQVLLRHHWRLSPELVAAQPGYRERIVGTTAGVIIGDPAIRARSRFAYYYDLGLAWRELTDLPFVYAAWLSAVPLPRAFVADFDAAQAAGVKRRRELAAEAQHQLEGYDLERYFTRQIHYRIDHRAERGRAEFLRLGNELLRSPGGVHSLRREPALVA